jgi:hypothetical protein
VQLPVKTLQEKTAEQSKQLRIQFPVSSGQQHRKSGEYGPFRLSPSLHPSKCIRLARSCRDAGVDCHGMHCQILERGDESLVR